MILVTLADGTIYQVDSMDVELAKQVVEYKLRLRQDSRSIQTAKLVWGVPLSPSSKTYNSADSLDGRPLVCLRGWSYKGF